MFRNFYYTIFLVMLLVSCNQKKDSLSDSRNDSIKKYLELAGNLDLDFVQRKKYNDRAFSFLNLNRNDSLTRNNLYIVGINNYNLMQFEKLEKNSKKLYVLSMKTHDQNKLACSLKLRGLSYMMKSDNEKAIEEFYKAKKIFLKLNKKRSIVALDKDISDAQYYSSDFLGSNETIFKSLETIDKLDNKMSPDLFRAYDNIAANFAALKDYNNSIKFEKESLKYTENKLKLINTSYSGIAFCYKNLKEYNKATYYVNKILDNPKSKTLSPLNYYSMKSLLGYLNLLKGKKDGLPKLFYEVEEYYSKHDDAGGQDDNQINLSEYYAITKDTINAIKAAQRALSISKSYRNSASILYSLNQLIKVDKKNASTNALEYIHINDSLQVAERRFRNKFANVVFETNKITQEKETAVKQKWILVSISGSILLILTLLLIITRQRVKQKQLKLLQIQQSSNEEIYNLMLMQKSREEEARQSEKKRIALELHDGVMNRLASTRLNLDVLHHKRDNLTVDECLIYVDDIYNIEQEIRSIAHNLSLESFNQNNSFASLIEDFIVVQNNTFNTNYRLEMDESINWDMISGTIKMNLFRIIQEASHNINKFAQAGNAIISLIIDRNNICLSITDNGRGFDIEKTTEGIGLKNIKQRVESLDGKLNIQSIKDKSTSINIAIPHIKGQPKK